MGNFFSMLGRRLQEPSTWAAISALLGVFGVVDAQQAAVLSQAGSEIAQASGGSDIELNLGIIGSGISALIAAFVPERGAK